MSRTAPRCVLQHLATSVAQWDWAPAIQSGTLLPNASFLGFLASQSHLSISPLVLPGITSSANYLHANLSMEVCFLETDPNTAKHGQSTFWEEGTALAKAQRYDRASLVWGSERS